MSITPIEPNMFITPIKPMEPFAQQGVADLKPTGAENGSPFKDLVRTALDNMKTSEEQVTEATAALASGTVDDLHTLGILNTKAYLAERLVIEVRNRTMDAYSEIMRINI